MFPQDEHERLLIAKLQEVGVSVERQTVVSYRDEGDRMAACLRRPDGQEETCEADYIAGCDGVPCRELLNQASARSKVATSREADKPAKREISDRLEMAH
jgi:2-polyprenyl-6-methoxyphenol hydroxylase-like FAD-dependent oxidoreductase